MIARTKKLQKGFTLIELLVVIGILAVLLAITLIAINPARQFSQSNDTKRRSDVSAILNAIDQYAAENAGNLPTGMPAAGNSGVISNTGQDICAAIVPQFIAQMPSDPKTGNPKSAIPTTTCAAGVAPSGAYNTGYTVAVASGTNGRVTVSAVPELAASISVTR